MRIPMPPEMPESLGQSAGAKSYLSHLGTISPNICFRSAQGHNPQRHQKLHAQQPQRMCQILCENRDQDARNRQVPQRHPFKRSARTQNIGHLSPKNFPNAPIGTRRQRQASLMFASIHRVLPGRSQFALLIALPARAIHRVHLASTASSRVCAVRALSAALRCSVHASTAQSRRRASCFISSKGFTTQGRPTASSIGRSLMLSPYA